MGDYKADRSLPPRENLWLHRFAVVLAFCTLFLIVAGASVTSNQAGLSVPDWPLSYGQVMPEMKGGVFYEHGHRMIASTVGFLTIILAVWLARVEPRAWVRRLGWFALLAVIVQGVLGGLTVIYMLPPPVSIAHACLAQIFFAVTVAIAAFTSTTWLRGSDPVEDSGWPSLRSLAVIIPVLVLAQIALGAGYRHRAFGIMPHVLGAIVVGAAILMFAVFVLVQFPSHRLLKMHAWHVIGITIAQIVLGIIAYLARVSSMESVVPVTPTVILTVAHVGFGAITMAAAVALSLQVFRHVRRAPSSLAAGGVPVASR